MQRLSELWSQMHNGIIFLLCLNLGFTIFRRMLVRMR